MVAGCSFSVRVREIGGAYFSAGSSGDALVVEVGGFKMMHRAGCRDQNGLAGRRPGEGSRRAGWFGNRGDWAYFRTGIS